MLTSLAPRARRGGILVLVATLIAAAVAVFAPTAPAGAAVPEGTTIAGTVTDAVTGLTIQGIEVAAIGAGSTYTTTTDAFGEYTLGGLSSDDYIVSFTDHGGSYLAEYYDDVPDSASATVLIIDGTSDHLGISAAMHQGGTISGVVTDSGSGLPLDGATVTATSLCGCDSVSATTDINGAYSIYPVPAGSYSVQFATSGYVDGYYLDTLNEWEATPVDIVWNETVSGIDGSIGAAPTGISGTVIGNLSTLPISGIDVIASSATAGTSATTTTDSNGDYSFVTLEPADDYVVHFTDTSGTWREQYFFLATDTDEATPVVVTDGQMSGDVDGYLEQLGSISGVVSEDGTGTLLEGVTVTAREFCGCGDPVTTTTDIEGKYQFTLPAGDYEVSFKLTGYTKQYWENTDFAGATPVTVNEGADTSGIDAALVVADPTGISGTVTDAATGLPLADVLVYVDGTNGFGMAETEANGEYEILGLAPGEDYIVTFDSCSCDYEIEWWNGVHDPDLATPVIVVDGITTTGIDAALDPLVNIQGRVTDSLGNGIPNVAVFADTVCGCDFGYAVTDSDGDYIIWDLPAAEYTVYFQSPDEWTWSSEWYDNAFTPEDATILDLSDGSDAEANAQLDALTGVMKGRVVDEAGNPIAGARVTIFYPWGDVLTTTVTKADGRWGKVVPYGWYIIRYGMAGYTPVFNGGATTFDAADEIYLAPGDRYIETATLVASARVEGIVTSAVTGLPVANARVTIYDPVTSEKFGALLTDENGHYLFSRVPAGSYKLLVQPTSANPDLDKWWAGGGGQTRTTATPVPFLQGVTNTYDFVLPALVLI